MQRSYVLFLLQIVRKIVNSITEHGVSEELGDNGRARELRYAALKIHDILRQAKVDEQ